MSAPLLRLAAGRSGRAGTRGEEILGHSSIAVTMNIHTHVLDESKRDAAAVLELVFGAEAERA